MLIKYMSRMIRFLKVFCDIHQALIIILSIYADHGVQRFVTEGGCMRLAGYSCVCGTYACLLPFMPLIAVVSRIGAGGRRGKSMRCGAQPPPFKAEAET